LECIIIFLLVLVLQGQKGIVAKHIRDLIIEKRLLYVLSMIFATCSLDRNPKLYEFEVEVVNECSASDSSSSNWSKNNSSLSLGTESKTFRYGGGGTLVSGGVDWGNLLKCVVQEQVDK